MKRFISLFVTALIIVSTHTFFVVPASAADGGNTVLEWFYVDKYLRNENGGYRTEVRNGNYISAGNTDLGKYRGNDVAASSVGVTGSVNVNKIIVDTNLIMNENKVWCAWLQNVIDADLKWRTSDVSKYENTAMAVMKIRLDKGTKFDLNNYYIVLGDHKSGLTNGENLVGVKLSDYYSEEDCGIFKTIRVPLALFKDTTGKFWGSSRSEVTERGVDFSKLVSFGIAWKGAAACGIDTVYVYDMRILNVEPPTNLYNDSTSQEVNVIWDKSASDNIASYDIYRDGLKIASVSGSETKYKDTDVQPDVNYTYTVKATDIYGGESMASSETLAYTNPVDAPIDFKAECLVDELAVKLTWKSPQNEMVSAYAIYRDNVEIARLQPNEEDYTDRSGLVENTYYTYRMISLGKDGRNSNLTPKVTVYATYIDTPKEINSKLSRNTVELDWSQVNNAVGYNVYCNNELIVTVNENHYELNNISYDVCYNFHVRAKNKDGHLSLPSKRCIVLERNIDQTVYKDIFSDGCAKDISIKSEKGGIQSSLKEDDKISSQMSFPSNEQEPEIIYNKVKLNDNDKDILNLSTLRDSSSLTFIIDIPDEVNLNNVYVGLCNDVYIFGSVNNVRSSVLLSNYVTNTRGNFQYVKIPLSDFPDKGSKIIRTQTVEVDFKFDAVKGISFYRYQKGVINDVSFKINELRIYDCNSPQVLLSLDDGTVINENSVISADTKSLKIGFDSDMIATDLNADTIKLYQGDTEIPTFGTYNTNEKKYNLMIMENLTKDTQYRLSVENVKSTKGKTISAYSRIFQTDLTEPTVGDVVLPLQQMILGNDTVKDGQKATVDISVGGSGTVANKVSELKLEIRYNSGLLSIADESNVVFSNLNYISKPTVDISETGKIIIEAATKNDTVWIPAGKVCTIEFKTIKKGNATVSLKGNFNVLLADSSLKEVKMQDCSSSVIISESGQKAGDRGSAGGGRPVKEVISKPIESQNNDLSNNLIDAYEMPWAEESINYLARNKIIEGYPDKTFKPGNLILREEFATVLVKAFELPAEDAVNTFADVKENDWFCKFIAAAKDKGIINGKDDGTFGAGTYITRQEMCAMLYRAIKSLKLKIDPKYNTVIFSDESEIDDFAKESVKFLQEAGIVNGVGGNKFSPKEPVNRAMAAKVIYEILKVK